MKERFRLHIRVLGNRSVFHEWTFDNPSRVSIGFSSSASVWLFDGEAGASDELFFKKGSEFRLRISSNTLGAILIDEKKISLQSLRTAGLIRVDSGGEFIAIFPKSSGELTLGKTEIQFWVTSSPKDVEFPAHPLL